MNNKSLALNLSLLACGMLMLAYASVPLYRIFCQITGYGGTTQQGSAPQGAISKQTLAIRFNADTDPALKWHFSPGEKERVVHIGEQALTHFVAKNLSDKPLVGRAVYNVLPFQAGSYFVKVDCFCFREQTLLPGQQVNMPVSFYIDPAMLDDPEMKDVQTITLSYTFFELKK